MASTRSPALMRSAVSCWPTSKPLASSRRSSTRCRPGSDAGGGEVALLGLVRAAEARRTPQVTCRAEYPSRSGVFTCTTRTGATLSTVTGMARLLLVPDLGHADLLADDRLGRHGGCGPFRPRWLRAARHVAARLRSGSVGAVTGARFACQRSARESRAERSPGSAPRSLPMPAGARRRRNGQLGRNRPDRRRYTMGSGACHTPVTRFPGAHIVSATLVRRLRSTLGGNPRWWSVRSTR